MQRRLNKKMFEKLALALAAAILILLSVGIAKEYAEKKAMDRQIAELTDELQKMNKSNTGFLRSIQAFQSGFFIEQEARTKLNLVKPGEKVVVIPSTSFKNEIAGNNAEKKDDTESKVPAWQNAGAWWWYFFGEKS